MVSANPQVTDNFSPLSVLAEDALRIYAEFQPSTLDSETLLLFLEFANDIVDDINAHPYWRVDQIDHYTSPEDIRPIPDRVMIAGLLAYYAAQQGSPKVQIYGPKYQRTANRNLWHVLSGGSGKIQMRPMDGATNPRNISGKTFSSITGMPEEDE